MKQKPVNSMTSGYNTVILPRDVVPGESSLEAVLDTACDRLRERHIQHSIRRIRELEEQLRTIEEELNNFLILKSGS